MRQRDGARRGRGRPSLVDVLIAGVFAAVTCMGVTLLVRAGALGTLEGDLTRPADAQHGSTAIGSAVAGSSASADEVTSIDAADPSVSRPRVELPRQSPSAATTLRSHAAAEETTILFLNNGSLTVAIDWIDYDGNRQTYSILEHGESDEVTTYPTHPWVVRTLDGRVLFVVLPLAQPGVVTVQ